MGAKAMKITVVGAALIIAAGIVVLVVIQALNGNQNASPQQDQAV